MLGLAREAMNFSAASLCGEPRRITQLSTA